METLEPIYTNLGKSVWSGSSIFRGFAYCALFPPLKPSTEGGGFLIITIKAVTTSKNRCSHLFVRN